MRGDAPPVGIFLLLLLCLTASPALAIASAPSPSPLQSLMTLLSQRQHGKVPYTEKDYLSVLSKPLDSSGILLYDAPDHLEKRTLKPRPETLILDHGQVTVRRGDRTYHFNIESYPEVAPYVDAIRATMAGDLPALKRVFHVSFQGTLAHWTLKLVPRDRKVARGMRRIRIAGARDDVQSVQIDKPDGDRSVMTLGAPEGSPDP